VVENIAVPTPVLYGEEEVFDKTHFQSYRRRIADVETREIPNTGHNSDIGNPGGFTVAVRDSLQCNGVNSHIYPGNCLALLG
jgi:pimeloyl-ACP methyl ester carboxylesterase